MWGPIALRAEVARGEQGLEEAGADVDGGHMGGLSMDLWKYYDLVDAPTAIGFLEKMGLDSKVATALRSFYGGLWRITSINGACGQGFAAHQSVLQGCAWSNPCAAAIAVATTSAFLAFLQTGTSLPQSPFLF